MVVKTRLWTACLLLILMLASYTALRHYTPALVGLVVEESLIRKAPDGSDPGVVRGRFRDFINAAPSESERLNKLLALSQDLEKVQKLNDLELDKLFLGPAVSPVN